MAEILASGPPGRKPKGERPGEARAFTGALQGRLSRFVPPWQV
jgi:hypothetical protein